ncbi:MAG: PQQ-binding-like beta-propeller repeat protein [Acidobacteriota bacterium]|nr:PQQ-binding-like beta-propeller repeat protein [Acidobacteriota bacterium]
MLRTLVCTVIASACAAAATEDRPDGKVLFAKQCAVCHKPGGENRVPVPEALGHLSKAAIVAALDTGSMKVQGASLSPAQRMAIADFLTAGNAGRVETGTANACAGGTSPLPNLNGWNGWGVDPANTRFQPGAAAGLPAADVPKLKLKWAFGFAGSGVVYGQPTIAGGRLFFGSADGTVYSADARSGCVYWTFKAPTTVRSAITIDKFGKDRMAAWFGDVKANVFAVDAATGELLWKTTVDDHPVARVTGSPKLYQGRLYVPVSSIEEVSAGSASYPCCKFRGSVVALDAVTGKQIWKTYAIPDAPTANGKNKSGTDRFGPAGAAIWSSPTLDLKRKLLYVGTGNQYSDPVSKYSDAVLALDLETGSMRWAKQLAEGDHWNFGCINPNKASCPDTVGPDVDIGSSPILKSVNGRDVLVVGQKSGIVHGIDPDKRGEILWQVRIGRGGALGGIMWGSAAAGDAVYVPLSDFGGSKAADGSTVGGGLFALKIATGEKIWYAPPVKPACEGKSGCSPSQMAPATAIPGVVFSGSMDGHLRAYSMADGSVVWDFDTLRAFETVNGVAGKGGSLSASGPTIAGGMLFVNSGYGALGGMAGNVLLAFSVDGK